MRMRIRMYAKLLVSHVTWRRSILFFFCRVGSFAPERLTCFIPSLGVGVKPNHESRSQRGRFLCRTIRKTRAPEHACMLYESVQSCFRTRQDETGRGSFATTGRATPAERHLMSKLRCNTNMPLFCLSLPHSVLNNIDFETPSRFQG